MTERRLTAEHALYILAFIAGSFFRLYHLGSTPLSDFEASQAMQALSRTVAAPDYASGSSTYLILTKAAFDVIGSSDFLARFWPAVAGSLLVLAPLFFRRELGRVCAIILAFGLAIDPGLVAISRMAGGAMIAISSLIFAVGWIWAGIPILAGISLAISFLSSPTSIVGLSIFLILWLTATRLRLQLPSALSIDTIKQQIKPALASAGLTFLAAAIFSLGNPTTLPVMATSIADYFAGWASSSGYSFGKMLFMLVIYLPIPVFLLLTQVFYWLIRQSFTDETIKPPPPGTLLWLSVSILVVFIYPGKQPWDLVWVIIPMWVFTAQILNRLLPEGKLHVASLVLAGTIFILLALFWNTIVSSRQIVSPTAFNLPESTSRLLIQLILTIGVIGLGGLSTLLVSLGWSSRVGQDGLVIGLLAGFLVYSISAMWGVSQLRQNRPEELWFPPPATDQADLFIDTVQQVSEQNTGFAQTIDILSVVDSPSMHWVLRNFHNARYTSGIPIGEMPSIVITSLEEQNPSLEATYRGQDFSWSIYPGWTGIPPGDFLSWLVTRQAPVSANQVILWVRSDRFPGEEVNLALPEP